MQNNINVYTGNDARFGQLRNALLFMVSGLVVSVILLSGLLVRVARRHFRTARIDPHRARQPAGTAGKDGCLCHP